MNENFIQRSPHDKENPYVMIRKKSIQDSRLSIEARGMLAYLLSLPSDWRLKVPNISKSLKIGRDRTYKAIKELTNFGYMRSERKYVNNIKNEITYFISEYPCPIDKSSTSWISTSRKQGRILSNKKLNNKKETTSNKEKKPVASEVSDNLLLFSSEKGKAIHLKLNESLAKGYLTKDKFDIACKHLKHHEQKKTLSTKGFKYFTYLAHKEIEIIIPPPTAEELHDKFCKARQTELQKIYERDVNKKVFYTIIGKEEFGCFISGRGVYIKFSTMSEDNFNLLKKNLTNLVNWTYKSTHAA